MKLRFPCFAAVAGALLAAGCLDRHTPAGPDRLEFGPAFSLFTTEDWGVIELPLPEGASASQAFDLNDHGSVVGYSIINGMPRPTLWVDMTPHLLPTLPECGPTGVATGINNPGQVVAYCFEGSAERAYLWQGGTTTPIPLPPGASSAIPRAINNHGHVVGESTVDVLRAWLYRDGTTTLLDNPPGAGGASAQDVNDQGVVAGLAFTPNGPRAVLWDEAGVPTILSNNISEALAISNAGIAGGWHNAPGQGTRGVLWDGQGGEQQLPPVPGTFGCQVSDVNDQNHAAVRCSTLSGPQPYYHSDGTTIPLPVPSGATVCEVRRISDAGEIAGRCSGGPQGDQGVSWQVSRTDGPPVAPSDVVATWLAPYEPGPQEIGLTWTDNSDNERSFVLQQRIQNPDGSWGSWHLMTHLPANTTSYIVQGLPENHEFQYRVRACNDDGCSDWVISNRVHTFPAPPPPPEVTATCITPSECLVEFVTLGRYDLGRREADNTGGEAEGTDEEDGPTNWKPWQMLARRLECQPPGESGTGPSSTTPCEYRDTTVSPGTRYRYRVRACNPAGCSAWSLSPVVTTPQEPPAAPGNILATAVSASQVDVTWDDNSDNEARFRLQRRTRIDGTWGTWSLLEALPANTTSYSDTGASGGRTYRYRVQACNSGGCSDWSISPLVTTPGS
jgi:hypothetical protein